MSHCCHHKKVKEPTKPEQGSLNNLAYLELCTEVKEAQIHATKYHPNDLWKCGFAHSWIKIIDQDYDTHRVCERCGKYKPTSWANPGIAY